MRLQDNIRTLYTKNRTQAFGAASAQFRGRNSKIIKSSSAGQDHGPIQLKRFNEEKFSPSQKTTAGSELEEELSIEVVEEVFEGPVNVVRESIKFSMPRVSYIETEASDKPIRRHHCMSFAVSTEQDLYDLDQEVDKPKTFEKQNFLKHFSSFKQPRFMNKLLPRKSAFLQYENTQQDDYLPIYEPVCLITPPKEISAQITDLKEYHESLSKHMSQLQALDTLKTPKKTIEKTKRPSASPSTPLSVLFNTQTCISSCAAPHFYEERGRAVGHIDLLGGFSLELSEYYHEDIETLYDHYKISKKTLYEFIADIAMSKQKAIEIILEISNNEYRRKESEQTGTDCILSAKEVCGILRIPAFCSLKKTSSSVIKYNLFNYPCLLLV